MTGQSFGSTSGPFPLILCARAGAPFPQINLSEDEVNYESYQNFPEDLGMRGSPESLALFGVHETVLGIGMNDMVCLHLGNATSPRFALQVYANFLLRFGSSVMGIPASRYYDVISEFVIISKKKFSQFDIEELQDLVSRFKGIQPISENVWDQLRLAIISIYSIWFSDKAEFYRNEVLSLLPNQGVAICIQTMVFGKSGTCFSRSPITGDNRVVGDFWPSVGLVQSMDELKYEDPETGKKLQEIAFLLEKHFRDVQVGMLFYKLVYSNLFQTFRISNMFWKILAEYLFYKLDLLVELRKHLLKLQ
jgi:hypothetical protein